jgi:hypothetical protein
VRSPISYVAMGSHTGSEVGAFLVKCENWGFLGGVC